jgi:hypothetical protein
VPVRHLGNRMGYGRLKLSSSGCVHFMYADFFSGAPQAAVGDLRSAGVRCVYTDYRNVEYGDLHIANAVARELKLQHAPYPPPTSTFQPQVWVPFLDDLITLSEHEKKGVVLFVDSAYAFLAENSKGMFRLIEVFLIQVHHWMEKKKPCHLCFQMEPDDSLRAQFTV